MGLNNRVLLLLLVLVLVLVLVRFRWALVLVAEHRCAVLRELARVLCRALVEERGHYTMVWSK
jgi:hypothetical protein